MPCGEAAVGQLQAGHDVADGVDVGQVGAQALVGEHEAAVHGDALLLVAEVGGGRAAADRDQQQLGLDGLAAGDGHPHAGLGALDLLERLADLEADAALAEGPLERLGGLLVLGRDQAGQRLHDGHVDAEGRHTLANSTPMTPPPSTMADAGTRSSVRACSEAMTRSPSISRPGQGLASRSRWPARRCGRCSSLARRPPPWSGPTSLPVPST